MNKTRIAGHNVMWECDVEGLVEIPREDIQYIADMIDNHKQQGDINLLYREGTIHWWIIDWEKLCEEMYNAMCEWLDVAGRTTMKASEVMKRYEQAKGE